MSKILIVDDDENNRIVLSDTLAGDGYLLAEATNGEEALQAVAADPPDLILLDIVMPVKDGFETLRQLKANPLTERIPVIMVTSLNMDSQIALCLNEGAADHITKPFSRVVVRARVRAAIRQFAAAAQSADMPRRGKVIGIVGVKGGVGASTLAVNLAWALKDPETSVTLAEMHAMAGSCSDQLAMNARTSLAKLCGDDSRTIAAQAVEDLLLRHPDGVRILFAPPWEQLPLEVSPSMASLVINHLAALAHYTVLDIARYPWPTCEACLRLCDWVLLAIDADPLGLASGRGLLQQLRQWEVSRSKVSAVVIKRAAVTAPLSVPELRTALDCDIAAVLPPDPDGCLAALRQGTPLMNLRPESLYSGAVANVARTCRTDKQREPQLAAV
jgi:CheY-like chemotaxis protein/MinD-like ATPase involved in chromosome partitioning or flagellar assembly